MAFLPPSYAYAFLRSITACLLPWMLLMFIPTAFCSLKPVIDHLSVKPNWQAEFMQYNHPKAQAKRGPPISSESKVQLVITNHCESTIWPALATQAGTGPGIGGFELQPGSSKKLSVAWNWQGRIWGRTNCTVNGESCACQTGDCFAKLDCQFSVSIFKNSSAIAI